MKEYISEFNAFLIKIAIPSIIGISIKIATQLKTETVTFTRVIISYVVGIGCAYFAFPFINTIEDKRMMSTIIGVVAISGEKIMEFLIYRWNIDYFLSSLMEAVRQLIIKLFTK